MSTMDFYDRQRRTQTKASVFRFLALLMIGLNVVGALICAYIWSEMRAIANGALYSDEQLTMYDDLNGTIGTLQLGIGLVLTISFFVWKYSAYKLTTSYGAVGRNYTPAKAVYMYFIPFLSLYVPYKIMVELYKISTFLAKPRDSEQDYLIAWSHQPVPQIILVWWVVFLIVQTLDKIILRVYAKNIETIESYLSLMTVMTVADLLGVLSVSLLLVVVIKISVLQKNIILTEDEASDSLRHDSGQ